MTEREWFAVQDPLVLLAFVQEHSGVALLKPPPRESAGKFPDLPGSMGRSGVYDLYHLSPEPGHEQEAELIRRLHRYSLACCRAIWPLLTCEESRRGVEVAELYVEGRATDAEFKRAEWNAEGAAFFWEYVCYPPRPDDPNPPSFVADLNAQRQAEYDQMTPEERDHWRQIELAQTAKMEAMLREVAAIPAAQMRRMVRVPVGTDPTSLRRILGRAAYFAHKAILLPGHHPLAGTIDRYPEFLSADLLRRFVRYPLHAKMPGPGHVWWARYGTKA